MTAQQWELGLMTIAGFVYEHQGTYYRAKFAHTAMDGYPPHKCPDLYDHIKEDR